MKQAESKRCRLCGSKQSVQVHHIEWNPDHNSPENQIYLCKWHYDFIRENGYLSRRELELWKSHTKPAWPYWFSPRRTYQAELSI